MDFVCQDFFYFSFFSILVFAQGRSNRVLTLLIALSFYIQIIVSMSIFNSFGWNNFGYVLATEHPVVRLPVFLMGVFAGVLCIRIQQGDYDALQGKFTM